MNDEREIRGTILVVDDKVENLKLLIDFLEGSAFRTLIATDGTRAVEIAETALPDLILLDVVMPGIDGYETCDRLKQNPDTEQIPIIFLSALKEPENVLRAFDAGGVDYITKPFRQAEVLARVNTHITLARQNEEMQRLTREMSREVDERKKSEEKLRWMNYLFDAVVAHTPNFFSVIEPDGSYRFVNKSVETLLNRKYYEIIGLTAHDLLPRETADLFMERIHTVVTGRKPVTVDDVILIDGKKHFFATTLFPMIDSSGEVYAVGGLAVDITDQKETEAALRRSETQLNVMIDAFDESVFLLNKDFTIAAVNAAVAERLGYKKAELSGKNALDLHPPELAMSRKKRAMEVFQSGGAVCFEDRRLGRIIENRIHPVKNEFGEVESLAVLGIDVTDRKSAEEALQKAETQLKVMIDAFDESVFLLNKDFTIAVANAAAAKRFGYEKQALAGLNVLDLIPPEIAEFRKEKALTVFRTGAPVQFEDERLGRTFQHLVHPIPNEAGEVELVAVLALDITDRKAAEEALSESESRLRLILENMPVMLDAFDEQNRILFWNRECERVTGYTKEEVLGTPNIMEFFYPDPQYRKRIISEFQERFSRNDEIRGMESVITEKTGRKKTIMWWNISKQCPVPGWFTWSVGIDVTERAKALESLMESEGRARALLAAIPDMMFRMDRDGVFLDYKARREDLFAQTESTIIGKRCHDLLPAELADLTREYIRKTLTSGELQVYEYAGTIPGRGLREYEGRMVKSGQNEVTVIVRDITKEKAAEKRLREINAALEAALRDQRSDLQSVQRQIAEFKATARTILNGAPGSAALFDPEGIFLEANDACCTMFCTEKAHLIGNHVWPFLTETGSGQIRREFEAVVKNAAPGRFQTVYRETTYDAFLHPVCDTDGKVVRVVGFAYPATTESARNDD